MAQYWSRSKYTKRHPREEFWSNRASQQQYKNNILPIIRNEAWVFFVLKNRPLFENIHMT